jgi:hypothetical protein
MTSDSGAQERAKQFEFLRLRAAKLLKVPPEHQSAYVRAGIDLAYELSLNDMIDTGRVREPASFIKLSELEMAQAPPVEAHVTIEIVKGGKKLDGLPPPEASNSPSPVSPPAETSTAVASTADNVVAMRGGANRTAHQVRRRSPRMVGTLANRNRLPNPAHDAE